MLDKNTKSKLIIGLVCLLVIIVAIVAFFVIKSKADAIVDVSVAEREAAKLQSEALKLAESAALAQKEADYKLAEQREAERKLAVQKEVERKLAEQKETARKLAEQKVADQKVADQKAAEVKAALDLLKKTYSTGAMTQPALPTPPPKITDVSTSVFGQILLADNKCVQPGTATPLDSAVCDGSTQQKWSMDIHRTGTGNIKSMSNSKCLNSASNGAVIMGPCSTDHSVYRDPVTQLVTRKDGTSGLSSHLSVGAPALKNYIWTQLTADKNALSWKAMQL
jgi:uncharacterized coiled-coil protein SlyX